MSGEKVRKVVGRRWRRRGAVTVQVAVLSGVIMGFAALAIDVGMLYTSKAELQAACDSAALAAAAQLSAEGHGGVARSGGRDAGVIKFWGTPHNST